MKVLFRGFGCKTQTKQTFKNVDIVLVCKSCLIGKCNNWCLQMQHVKLGTLESEHKGQKTGHSFSLFSWNYQIKIKQQFREFNKLFSDLCICLHGYIHQTADIIMIHLPKILLNLNLLKVTLWLDQLAWLQDWGIRWLHHAKWTEKVCTKFVQS